MSSTGDSARRAPIARSWRPMTPATSSTSSGSHVEARPIACGKFVAPGAHHAREGLLVGERRDAEPGLVRQEPLDPVDRLGGRDRVEPDAGDTRDLADAVGQVLLHGRVVEPALDQQLGVPDPEPSWAHFSSSVMLAEELVDVHH